jgi:hypothetical protein
MKRLAGFVLPWLLSLSALAATDTLPMRLPAGISPTAYQLALTVDPNQPQHSGEITISLDIKQPG